MSAEDLVAVVLSKVDKKDELKSVLKDKKVSEMVASLTKRGRKLKRDPGLPRRGKSAYLFFCAAHRDRVKKELGSKASATDVIKALGDKWNELKKSKKAADKKQYATYEHLARDDKSRYEREMEEYTPSEGYEHVHKKRKRSGPKRAMSAYLYFCEAHRKKLKKDNPKMSSAQITSKLGSMWNELKKDPKRSDELKTFEKKAEKDRKRYEKELKGESNDDDNKLVEVKEVKKSKSKKDERFLKFSKEQRPLLEKKKGETSKDRTKHLTKMWKGMSEEEKNQYA